MSTANSTTAVNKDNATTLVTSLASTTALTSVVATHTVTSSVLTSTGTSITSINTISSDASKGSMTISASTDSVTSSTFTETVYLRSSPRTVTLDPSTSYVTTKAFTSAESFHSSVITFTSNPSTNADTSNVSNTTVTLKAATSTITFNTINASSIHPSDATPYMTTSNIHSTNSTSSKPQFFMNNNIDLTIALSVSLSVIFLVLCIAVIIIVHRKCRRKSLSLGRDPVRIEVPDIFVRLSNQLVSHKLDQHISQSPAVLGMEEIQRISSSSIINSKIPDKKAEKIGIVSHKVEAIATIDITEHAFHGKPNTRKKGDNSVFVPEIVEIPVVTRSGNTGEFLKQEHKQDGVSEKLKALISQNIEDETFAEIKL
ncbi:hypothetical protein CHS0354_021764 [Potamilus streckersoni]|uniref:Uncharacterized protein n=1 Tax=Potamilus streckersoni TaxID=2493646 RepID=A0AAE0WEW2_9BIVA|nr:hypothetical protein CHS0354_021764 [Potamilus streckersoni]